MDISGTASFLAYRVYFSAPDVAAGVCGNEEDGQINTAVTSSQGN